jgi:hypothetical protein
VWLLFSPNSLIARLEPLPTHWGEAMGA